MNVMKKEVPDRDKLIIINNDGTADIANVYDRNDMSIYAESQTMDYNVPVADLQKHVSPHGIIYTLKADSDYIQDTARLALLEKSIVLRQVTQFEHVKEEPNKIDIKQIMLFALIGVLVLGVIFK